MNAKAIAGRRRKKASSTRWTNVDEAAIPFDDKNPMVFPDAKEWDELTKSRAEVRWPTAARQRSEREIEIEKKLRTPVSLQFTNAPLSKVLELPGQAGRGQPAPRSARAWPRKA